MKKHTTVSKFGRKLMKLEIALATIYLALKILLVFVKLVAVMRA